MACASAGVAVAGASVGVAVACAAGRRRGGLRLAAVLDALLEFVLERCQLALESVERLLDVLPCVAAALRDLIAGVADRLRDVVDLGAELANRLVGLLHLLLGLCRLVLLVVEIGLQAEGPDCEAPGDE